MDMHTWDNVYCSLRIYWSPPIIFADLDFNYILFVNAGKIDFHDYQKFKATS